MYDVLESLQSSTPQLKESAAAQFTVEDDDPAIDLNAVEHFQLAQSLKKCPEDTMFINAAIQRCVLIPIGLGSNCFPLPFKVRGLLHALWSRHVRQEQGRSSGCDS